MDLIPKYKIPWIDLKTSKRKIPNGFNPQKLSIAVKINLGKNNWRPKTKSSQSDGSGTNYIVSFYLSQICFVELFFMFLLNSGVIMVNSNISSGPLVIVIIVICFLSPKPCTLDLNSHRP